MSNQAVKVTMMSHLKLYVKKINVAFFFLSRTSGAQKLLSYHNCVGVENVFF